MKLKQIRQWSLSTYKTYKTCPRKVKLNKLDGIKEPPSPQMQRGIDIHKLGEDFVKGTIKKLPTELDKFATEFKLLRKMKATAEEEWAFTKEWQPTGWFDANAWVRMKLDASYHPHPAALTVIDYKTGKVYEDNKLHMSLYALGAFLMHPEVEVVNVELWYLDQGETQHDTYTRDEVKDMIESWVWSSSALLNDTTFAPRPGYYCRWCFYSKAKGGQCEF